jgi:hypothetical protein
MKPELTVCFERLKVGKRQFQTADQRQRKPKKGLLLLGSQMLLSSLLIGVGAQEYNYALSISHNDYGAN